MLSTADIIWVTDMRTILKIRIRFRACVIFVNIRWTMRNVVSFGQLWKFRKLSMTTFRKKGK